MDITLKEIATGSVFTFPSLPEKITRKMGTKYQTYEIMEKGTVKIPRGSDVESVSWDGVFYGAARRGEPMMKLYFAPNICVTILRILMQKGAVLRLMVTNTGINMDVTISSFTAEETGAFGDIKYSITFEAYRELKIYTTNEMQIAQFAKKTTPRASVTTKTHTIKSGDTLCALARKYYSQESKWIDIYNANSATIETAAKSHGYKSSDKGNWLFAGTVLTIP